LPRASAITTESGEIARMQSSRTCWSARVIALAATLALTQPTIEVLQPSDIGETCRFVLETLHATSARS